VPRYARIIRPGALVHVISRFVNGEFRIADDIERREYLRRAGLALAKSDWRIVSFAIMSSHPHLGAIAGAHPFAQWAHPLHSGFATWLNKRQNRFGPVFAERPKTIVLDIGCVGRLIAYHHNNPVHAGLVGAARDSTWTSHQAYLDRVSPSQWLDVRLGLDLCGFSDDPLGREQFDRFVQDAQTLPHDSLLEGGDLRRARRELRAQLGSAVEMSYPSVDLQQGTLNPIAIAPRGAVLQPRSTATQKEIVYEVAKRTSVSVHEMCSKTRVRRVVQARRLAIVVGRF
jgi:hypothetical protein